MGMYDDPRYAEKKVKYIKSNVKRAASQISQHIPQKEPEDNTPKRQETPQPNNEKTIEEIYAEIEEAEAEAKAAGLPITQYRECKRFLEERENASYYRAAPRPPEDHYVTQPAPRKPKGKTLLAQIAKYAIAAALIAYVIWDGTGSSPATSPPKGDTSNVQVEDPDSNLTPVKILSGQIVTSPAGYRDAPLEIISSGDDNYYIALSPVDSTARKNGAMSFYLSGKTLKTEVPLGKYEIFCACGETWYGVEHKFGANTSYFKFDETFEFSEDDEGTYGWTITLYKVSNGNLSTDYIEEADFPDI